MMTVLKFGARIKKQFLLFFFFALFINLSNLRASYFSYYFENYETGDSSRPTEAADRLNKAYWQQLGKDFLSLTTAPRRWQGPDIMNLAAVFGSVTVFFTLDQDIFNWVAERRTAFTEDLSSWVTKAGDGGWLLGFCLATYGLGEAVDKPQLRRVALLGLESLAVTSVGVTALKFIAGRARPHAWEGSQSFHPFSLTSRHTSFPSGHAGAAFAVATTIAYCSENKLIDITAYSLAGLVALARVHDEAHWASDVLAGSAIGYFIARSVINLHRPESKKVSILLLPSSEGLALGVRFSLD